jgi:hypothetical protein
MPNDAAGRTNLGLVYVAQTKFQDKVINVHQAKRLPSMFSLKQPKKGASMYNCLRYLLAALLLTTVSAMVQAQSSVDGAIKGTVSNPNKEVIANADVIVRNVQTNKEVISRTDESGSFRIVQLNPGTYSVDVNNINHVNDVLDNLFDGNGAYSYNNISDFNRVNVTSVNDTLYSLDSSDPNNLKLITEADFGLPGSTGLNNSFFFRERQVQLAVRFHF